MFPPLPVVFSLLSFSQFIPQSLALPANAITANANQNPSIPAGGPDSNQRQPIGVMFPSVPSGRLGTRPRDNLIWPEEKSGQYHVRFSHYKDHINYFEGKAVIQKALDDIDEWLKVAKKGGYTPVDTEHHWVEGKARISITPDGSGYLLADLQKYMNVISTMLLHYNDYFEWRGELIRTKAFGIVVKVGICSMSRDP
ncbi:MAG: hypothetical protein L6R38_008995 [Xanthoria sp. 2 TBL-2021]|nr:MAG: hypothetical protein L6R38_008995 [Xanthoria sp. 2 TBL-2021]